MHFHKLIPQVLCPILIIYSLNSISFILVLYALRSGCVNFVLSKILFPFPTIERSHLLLQAPEEDSERSEECTPGRAYRSREDLLLIESPKGGSLYQLGELQSEASLS